MDVVQGFSRNIKLRTKLILSSLINIAMLLLVAALGLNSLFLAQTGVNGMMKDDYPTIALGNQLIDEINTTIQKQALLLSPISTERRDTIMKGLQSATGQITEIYRKLNALATDDESMRYLQSLNEKRDAYLQARNAFLDVLHNEPSKALDYYLTTLASR